MKFEIINEEEFKSFITNHPLDNFIQTPEMAHIREYYGNKPYYVCVKKDGIMIAASMISARKTHFGLYEFYAPRGLLVNYNDIETLSFFVNSLREFIKSKKGYVLRIDPYYITHEKDIDGNDLESGIDNSNGIKNLENVGFKKSSNIYQKYKYMFSLDLNLSEDEIFNNFHNLTKRMIKKSKDYNFVVREASKDEIPIVVDLLSETGARKKFNIKNKKYFELLYDNFKPLNEVKFMIVEINLTNCINEKKQKLIENESNIELKQKLEKELIDLEDKKNLYGEKIAISAGVFMLHGNEYIYLFGGNKRDFMPYGSSYLLQWTMIKDAIKLGFKKYNFYGINYPEKSDGVYNFKRGFNGYVEELIGDYELKVNNYYYLNRFINKIRNR